LVKQNIMAWSKLCRKVPREAGGGGEGEGGGEQGGERGEGRGREGKEWEKRYQMKGLETNLSRTGKHS
jgi:hypothetical protein